MEEKKIEVLTDEEKIKLLEAQNRLLNQQNIIFQMNLNFQELQRRLQMLEIEIVKAHGKEEWVIGSNYILTNPKEVKQDVVG